MPRIRDGGREVTDRLCMKIHDDARKVCDYFLGGADDSEALREAIKSACKIVTIRERAQRGAVRPCFRVDVEVSGATPCHARDKSSVRLYGRFVHTAVTASQCSRQTHETSWPYSVRGAVPILKLELEANRFDRSVLEESAVVRKIQRKERQYQRSWDSSISQESAVGTWKGSRIGWSS